MALKRLFITEKPEMARSLAAGLVLAYGAKIINAGTARDDGCIKLDNGDAVGHLFGHMLENAKPEAYLKPEQLSGSYFAFLPLAPEKMIKLPKADRGKDGKPKLDRDGKPVPPAQFKKIVSLIRSAKEIVNAGDTDREGQLIVDELLEYAEVDPTGRDKPVWRLALENPKEEEISKLVKAGFEKNGDEKWVRRRMAAETRQDSDWCLGMTASMAYQEVTGFRRMAVGRVKTPTLAMVVKRDLEIERHKPVQYFVPIITLADGTQLRWERREGAEGTPGFDMQGRIIDEQLAKKMVAMIAAGMSGEINLADSRSGKELPPLPFSLGTLQSTAARRHGLSLQEVTKAAQSLYEKHKAITYVGTDCQYLPESMLEQAHDTMAALSKMYPKQATGANLDLRSKAWNDKKTDEHFAIAPTGKLPGGMNEAEKAVFETISRRYMAQFYPAHEYIKHQLGAIFGKDEFKSVRKEVVKEGWKEIEGNHEGESSEEAGGQEIEVRAEVEKQYQGDRE
jgi:DNA topoisomerase-3